MLTKQQDYVVPFHESWNIVDSSKLSDAYTCMRLYYFRHILGWRKIPGQYNDLEFGSAIHAAMEVILAKGTSLSNLDEAMNEFIKYYRQYFPVETDILFVKNPISARYSLEQYLTQYSGEVHNIIDIEIAGEVPITNDLNIHFKIDAVAKGPQGLYVLEHKTSGRAFSQNWGNSFLMEIQPATYIHVLHCIYGSAMPDTPIYGVYINGICIKPPPKLKKDGTPYANWEPPYNMRALIRKSPDMMNVWMVSTILKMLDIRQNIDTMNNEIDRQIMLAFPINPKACSMYRGCPFIDFCSSWANPLQHTQCPPGFEVKFWNPREKEITAKRVVRCVQKSNISTEVKND